MSKLLLIGMFLPNLKIIEQNLQPLERGPKSRRQEAAVSKAKEAVKSTVVTRLSATREERASRLEFRKQNWNIRVLNRESNREACSVLTSLLLFIDYIYHEVRVLIQISL